MRPKKSFNIQIYFIACVFVILCVALAASAGITFLLELFSNATVVVPTLMWMLMLSLVLGGLVTVFLSRYILSPITRLREAMRRVAAGDFTLRLETSGKIEEVQIIYESFNRMVEALGATETLQSDFVSNVSHEFKTPIGAIEGYAMLLQESQLPPKEQDEYVEKILFNTRRLSGLVRNILLLSRVDNQTMPGEKKPYRLDEQVRQAILSLEPAWAERDVDFDVELDPIIYRGSESLLFHVWTNLIGNAVKFSPPGGLVKIRLSAAAADIVFSVEDEGPGIPQEVQKHIFDRFYQADSSHKEEGNGLGLALAKRILDACGGAVAVRSEPGRGSSFSVTLPQGEQAAP